MQRWAARVRRSFQWIGLGTADQPLHHQQWKPLIIWANCQFIWSGKVYIIDCQSETKNYASGNHVSTSSCMLRIEKLITYLSYTIYSISLFHPSIPSVLWGPSPNFTIFSDTR